MTREELVEKGRSEYGIVNAADMSEDQLKAEIKAIDDQDPVNQKKAKQKQDDKKKNKNKK